MWAMVFVFLKMGNQAQTFLKFFKIQQPNLNFTIEEEHMKQLLIFYILNTRSERLVTIFYRKSTFAGLLQNYNSIVAFTYKKGLSETLIGRTFSLSNTWVGPHLDFAELKFILHKKNKYTPKLIDKSVSR